VNDTGIVGRDDDRLGMRKGRDLGVVCGTDHTVAAATRPNDETQDSENQQKKRKPERIRNASLHLSPPEGEVTGA
jgi:hypothetical protein